MKLLNLQLENFQGIKAAAFDFEGQSASIYGDNATGKTTVYNAITWLLFDRPSTGAKSFTPKTKGADGDLHYLDHAATGRFSMDDGRIVTLRKVFHEIYKKKRGSATEEFDGHGIDFFIDGVPVKEKEYTAALLAFCGGAEKMKMLTMPDYFAEGMAWDARRKILLDICGDVTDEEVIASTVDLKDLPAYLLMQGTASQLYTVDEYKKIAGAQKTDINRQLQDIPGRIDEAQRAMPEASGFIPGAIDGQLTVLNAEYERLTNEKAAILAGDTSAADLRVKISEANAKLAEARATHATRAATANEGIYAAIGEVQRSISDAKNAATDLWNENERRERSIKRMTDRRQELLSEYTTIQAEAWDEAQAVCPTCHRELPEDNVARMREDFNLRKSERLQKINERGQKEASKELLEAEDGRIRANELSLRTLEQNITDLEQQLAALQAQLKQPEPFETTDEYATMTAEIAAYRAQEVNAGNTTNQAVEGISRQIQDVQDQAKELQRKKSLLAQAQIQERRIDELKASERTLSAQFEELEKGIYLCDLFTKTKVGLLTDRINGKFRNVRFRLFVEQQNGGVRDDCEVMIPSESGKMVPFAFANNAARINAGLEVIGTLSKHWGLTMPVFIDNAESITRLVRMDAQVIRLVVSAADATLRMELDNQQKEGAA